MTIKPQFWCNLLHQFKIMSMGGLEPPRISPHAPQTCAYTDSATSTYIHYSIVKSPWRYRYTSLVYGSPHFRFGLTCLYRNSTPVGFRQSSCHIDILSVHPFYHKKLFVTNVIFYIDMTSILLKNKSCE